MSTVVGNTCDQAVSKETWIHGGNGLEQNALGPASVEGSSGGGETLTRDLAPGSSLLLSLDEGLHAFRMGIGQQLRPLGCCILSGFNNSSRS